MANSSAEQMTSAEVALVLGVSVRQVQRLADSGELDISSRVGSNILIDANSVYRLRKRGSQRGRPWSEETAWAAVELLDTGRTARLNDAQRSRLRARLHHTDVDEFVRLARRRADVHRYRASASFLARLRDHVALTGAAAVANDRSIADVFDLAIGNNNTVDGYVNLHHLRDFEDEFLLAADRDGNVVLRGVDTTSVQHEDRTASETAVALDLAESLDPRERSAGRRVLADKLRRA